MYAGHVGIALGAKALRRHIPLPLLVAAALGCDLVQVGIGLAGLQDAEQLRSHSVPAGLLIAAVLGLAYGGLSRSTRDAGFLALVALSHLAADYLTGRKLVWAGGPAIGLSLYDRPIADFAMETAVIVLGWSAFRRTLPQAARRSMLTWAVLVTLVCTQFALNYYDHLTDVENRRAARAVPPTRSDRDAAYNGRR